MRPGPLLLQKALELVETAGPAKCMPVARRNVEELFMEHIEFGAFARRTEAQGHERFTLGRALPGPGKHQFAVRLHFPVHAADVVLLAIERAEDDMKAATHPHIRFGKRDFSLVRPEPMFQRLRFSPGAPDFFRRDGKDTGEGERWLFLDLAGHGCRLLIWLTPVITTSSLSLLFFFARMRPACSMLAHAFYDAAWRHVVPHVAYLFKDVSGIFRSGAHTHCALPREGAGSAPGRVLRIGLADDFTIDDASAGRPLAQLLAQSACFPPQVASGHQRNRRHGRENQDREHECHDKQRGAHYGRKDPAEQSWRGRAKARTVSAKPEMFVVCKHLFPLR